MNNYHKFLILVVFALTIAASLGTVNQKIAMEINKLEERNLSLIEQAQSNIPIIEAESQLALAVIDPNAGTRIAIDSPPAPSAKGLKSIIRWHWNTNQVSLVSIGVKNVDTGAFSWIKTLSKASGTLPIRSYDIEGEGAMEWAPSSIGTFILQITAMDKNKKVLARSQSSPFVVKLAPTIAHARTYLASGGTMIDADTASNLTGVSAKITLINGTTTLLSTTTKPWYADYSYGHMYHPRFYLTHKTLPSGYKTKIEITRNGTTSQYITDPVIVSF